MISYIIPTYNRPYLLDACIKLLRKYSNVPIEVIVADGGSQYAITKKYENLDIDRIFVRDRRKYQSGHTFNLALRACKYKYCCFGTEDWFITPEPCLNFGFGEPKNDSLFPDLSWSKTNLHCLTKSLEILELNSSFKMIQMGRRDIPGRTDAGEYYSKPYCDSWFYLNHKKITDLRFNWNPTAATWLYNNGSPHMLRTEDYIRISPDDSWSMSDLECKSQDQTLHEFGDSDWICIADPPFFAHVGEFLVPEGGGSRLQAAQMVSKIVNININEYQQFLIDRWLSGEFFLDINDLQQSINHCFMNAFTRLG